MVNAALIPILVTVIIIVVSKNWKKYKDREISKKSFVLNVAILLVLISVSGYLLLVPS
ncbi:hypothetical protein IWX76_002239 [Pedobacter sp. CAN_A7]